MANKDVFISYKSEDFDDANWVKSVLENNGISCWMAPSCIPGGSSYAVEIPNAIRNCKVLVLILSERCQTSKWVPREIDQAINEGKTIMPFMLENCALKDDFNFYLSNVQRYAAYENKLAIVEKMLREIRAVLGLPEQNSAEEEKAEKPTVQPVSEEKPLEKADESKPEVEPAIEKEPILEAQKVKKENKVKAFDNSAPAKAVTKVADAKAEKPNKEKNTAKKKNNLLVLGGVAAAIVLVIVISVLVSVLNKVTIAGESYSKSETYLSISNEQITQQDIDNVSKLKGLNTLILENCELKVESFSGAFNEKLDSLKFKDCKIKSEIFATIEFDKLIDLSTLVVTNAEGYIDIAPVTENCKDLYRLCIDGCELSDYEALKALSSIEFLSEFSATGCELENIDFLSGSNISTLNIGYNNISSFEGTELPELTSLSAHSNKLTNLKGLEKSLKLHELNVGSNMLKSLEGLENTTVLSNVDISNNEISDISILVKSAETLKHLNIGYNKLTMPFNSLGKCNNLVSLIANNCGISSVLGIENLTALEELDLFGNEIITIDYMKTCTKLKKINLSGNRLISTDGLENMEFSDTDFAEVDLSGNDMSALKLPSGKKYGTLSIYGNKISNISALKGSSGTKLIFDYNTSIDIEVLKTLGFYEYVVVGCPLDKQLEISGILGEYCTSFAELNENGTITLPEE